MCGIVGYIGTRSAQSILVSGLEKLEYRGYDSAGVATIIEGNLDCIRAKGKLINLREKIEIAPITLLLASDIRAGRRMANPKNTTPTPTQIHPDDWQ